jgi:hypothetical protein
VWGKQLQTELLAWVAGTQDQVNYPWGTDQTGALTKGMEFHHIDMFVSQMSLFIGDEQFSRSRCYSQGI